MRKKLSISEIKIERDASLKAAVKKAYLEKEAMSYNLLVETVVKSPCERFWVSEERAAIVISDMLKGRGAGCTGHKARMFAEIFRRVQAVRTDNPGISIAKAVRQVIYSPAPEYYMSSRYALAI